MIHHDPITAEPYIRLPPPLSHIILTPPRLLHVHAGQDETPKENKNEGTPSPADISSITSALNDARVFPFLEGPPYPYLEENAVSIIRSGYLEAQHILLQHAEERHQQQQEGRKGQWVDGCPFRDIRDSSLPTTTTTSSESDRGSSSIAHALKIGDFKIARYAFYEFPHGSEQRRDARVRNEALPAGDEAVEWGVGFWLAPSHHKQGIMSAALQSIIVEWAVPRMNAYTIGACAFAGNEGSVKTMEKCGFVFQETIPQGSAELPVAKGGGGRRDLHVLKWRRNT